MKYTEIKFSWPIIAHHYGSCYRYFLIILSKPHITIQASKDTKIKCDIVLYVLKIPCIHFIEFVAELRTVHAKIITSIIFVEKNQLWSINLVSAKLKKDSGSTVLWDILSNWSLFLSQSQFQLRCFDWKISIAID